MTKITVRVPDETARLISALPGSTTDVAREALAIGLRKMARKRKKARKHHAPT